MANGEITSSDFYARQRQQELADRTQKALPEQYGKLQNFLKQHPNYKEYKDATLVDRIEGLSVNLMSVVSSKVVDLLKYWEEEFEQIKKNTENYEKNNLVK